MAYVSLQFQIKVDWFIDKSTVTRIAVWDSEFHWRLSNLACCPDTSLSTTFQSHWSCVSEVGKLDCLCISEPLYPVITVVSFSLKSDHLAIIVTSHRSPAYRNKTKKFTKLAHHTAVWTPKCRLPWHFGNTGPPGGLEGFLHGCHSQPRFHLPTAQSVPNF